MAVGKGETGDDRIYEGVREKVKKKKTGMRRERYNRECYMTVL